jgi:hypothetical protein
MRRALGPGVLALSVLAAGATDLLPAKVSEFARVVETVRGHKFDRAVSAGQIEAAELRQTLRAKLGDSFPASPEDTRKSLVALGLIEDTPNLVDRLVDFYASQVIAFYDPEPRRFFVVQGAEQSLGGSRSGARPEAHLPRTSDAYASGPDLDLDEGSRP